MCRWSIESLQAGTAAQSEALTPFISLSKITITGDRDMIFSGKVLGCLVAASGWLLRISQRFLGSLLGPAWGVLAVSEALFGT